MSSEITAEMIEDIFGNHSDSVRFANFCNAVVVAVGSPSAPTIPILSEKPGADGGMDAEWTIPADVSSDFKSPFGLPGWNVFQYKARSIAGDGRQRAFSNLCSNLKGTLAKLLNRLPQPKECRQYALFSSLQLGLETTTQTLDGALLQKRAVACEGVKLILTVPTDAKAPAPKLTEHEAIKTLPPLKPFIGPTPTNRKRLLQFIANKSVTPMGVTNMFRAGRWLDGVPVSEVVIIMEYMAQGDHWPQSVADVMSLYLHLNKPLPQELIPLGEHTLQEIDITRSESYHCNQIAIGIAKTDLEKGFALLEKRIAVLNELDWREWTGGWNPFDTYGGHEFWDYLRSQNTERAYRCFCTLKNRHIRNDILDGARALLDLENHSASLLKIANENEEDAERIAASVSIKQPRFFAFAFDLLVGRSIDGKVAAGLSSTIVERSGFGGPLDKLQNALSDIESELKRTDIPDHGHTWLERLKHIVQEAIKTSPWSRGENEYLGWS
jgi:hypothetical protein